MRAIEFVTEKKKIKDPTTSQCNVARSSLSNVRYSQCVSLGKRAHDTEHSDGTGRQGVKGSAKKLGGRKVKSERHGGRAKDYSGPSRGGTRRKS